DDLLLLIVGELEHLLQTIRQDLAGLRRTAEAAGSTRTAPRSTGTTTRSISGTVRIAGSAAGAAWTAAVIGSLAPRWPTSFARRAVVGRFAVGPAATATPSKAEVRAFFHMKRLQLVGG